MPAPQVCGKYLFSRWSLVHGGVSSSRGRPGVRGRHVRRDRGLLDSYPRFGFYPRPPAGDLGSDSRGLGQTFPSGHSGKSEEAIQIGGTLSSEADFFVRDGVSLFDNPASNPNILFLYLDSKLESDSRVFARARLFYDPTGLSGGVPNSGNLSNPYGFGNGSSENLNTSLQELRISANIDQKILFHLRPPKSEIRRGQVF